MKDIMLDIETLGSRSNAAIIQIGARYFDRETGEKGLGFSVNIDPTDLMDKFSVDYKTVAWWFAQDEAARKLVTESPIGLIEALDKLGDFLDEDANLWSHATFDIPILLHAFEVCGMHFPIHFRKMRDIRTLVDLADHFSDKPRDGIHHHALHDCDFQIGYCVEAMKKLNAQKQG